MAVVPPMHTPFIVEISAGYEDPYHSGHLQPWVPCLFPFCAISMGLTFS